MADGGWLAFQVPGNFDQPSHAILREMAERPVAPAAAGRGAEPAIGRPGGLRRAASQTGYEVDAWETTYVHILQGADPVLEWYRGTGLRPVLAVLDADQAADFLAEYGAQVREAYPPARSAPSSPSAACSPSPTGSAESQPDFPLP